ncbi:LacI family DNA-binding transcriptional regulator [Olsenella profusa]|uniref:Small molecule-binding regulator domain protein n=1 Tax=Olsenella profusa F0195 TaxID=1125712 RepID=U2TVZ3_9ACTN|nr:LacI family DNA-binding transcriptional regulator [Olsenella profusa]ERL10218.1 small molecule-binding regulator domain protein [Olsenella profusa F0195]
MDGQRVTIRDVARAAHTSTATVSHYLNGKFERMSQGTRRTVEQAIQELGYVPNAQARMLGNVKSGVIAVLLEDNTNAWAGRFVSGFETEAYGRGFQTVVCDTHFDPQVEHDYVEKMLSLGVDGFAIQPTKRYRAINERIKRARKPVVFYDFNLIDLTSTWVKTDLYGGVYDATSSCIAKGYEEFVVLAANVEEMRTRSERLRGLSDALEEHGRPFQHIAISHQAPSLTELRHQFEYTLNPSRRTLVFCMHQWALARTYEALLSMRQLIPERVGLLGLNNAEWTRLASPSISTLVEPVEEEGKLACTMLAQLIAGEQAPQQRILPCAVNWLESTR